MIKDIEKKLPERKMLRWQGVDYSNTGAYFVTICTAGREKILSNVVGDGALDVPHIELTDIGKIVEKYILTTSNIENVLVDRYVIMPNHIHILVLVGPREDVEAILTDENGTSRAPSPTNEMLPRIVGGLKRLCNRQVGRNLFQRSYYDHIIRDRKDYDTHVKYISENPWKWREDDLYIDA